MAEIKIQDVQLSLIWVETALDLVSDKRLTGNYGNIGHSAAYQQLYGQVQAAGEGGLKPSGIELPWRSPKGQLFWAGYLEKKEWGKLTSKDAWSSLVPFRIRLRDQLPLKVEVPWLQDPSYIFFETFLYPYGFAFSATARYKGNYTLDEVRAFAHKVAMTGDYDLKSGDEPVRHVPLSAVAGEYISAIRNHFFGPEVTSTPTAHDPFTIFTIIKGSGVNASKSIQEGKKVHNLLDSVTRWAENLEPDELTKLSDASLKMRQSPPGKKGDLFYGQKRSRAVWFPRRFTEAITEKHPPLSCYHRNLFYTTLQTESMAGLLRETAELLRNGETLVSLPVNHRECAQWAAGALGRMYGGRKSYKSYSARHQIEKNGWVSDIDEVRAAFTKRGHSMPPLTP